MTPTEYRDQIARLGLTQAGAAALLGVDARTSRNWACGERETPAPVVRLLWACERDTSLAEALTNWRGDG
jgi:DNA-binding transcriptional regulator YiaG